MMLAALALLVFLFFRFRVAPGSAPFQMVLEDLDGNNVVLPQNNQPLVLSFMKSWCGPCMMELEQWTDTLENYSNPPFQIIAVSDESPEIILRLSWKWQTNSSLKLLRSRTPFSEMGVRTFPTNYIFNHQGIIVHKQVGPLDLGNRELRNILRLP